MNPKNNSSNSSFKSIAIIILVIIIGAVAVWAIVMAVQRSGDDSGTDNPPPVPISENPEPTTRNTSGGSSVLTNSDAADEGRPSRTPLSGKESL